MKKGELFNKDIKTIKKNILQQILFTYMPPKTIIIM